ncbi:MAG: hypothetical protein IPF48_16585 [Sphingomonadales bacterium]|nr:hypothetical protein [Sphingomonadales bacterium]
MRKLIISASLGLAVLATGFASPALAQRAQRAPRAPVVRLPEGAEVRVATIDELSSKTASAGDTIYMRVIDPVRHNGVIVIPDGARVIGTVVSVRKRALPGDRASLRLPHNRSRSGIPAFACAARKMVAAKARAHCRSLRR